MATVYFITEQKEGETDILTPFQNETLKVYQDDKTKKQKLILELQAPLDGWTHKKLELVNDKLIKQTGTEAILDAYLSKSWVGSSEC